MCQKPFANAAAEDSHSHKLGFFACVVMKVLVIDERFSHSLNTLNVRENSPGIAGRHTLHQAFAGAIRPSSGLLCGQT